MYAMNPSFNASDPSAQVPPQLVSATPSLPPDHTLTSILTAPSRPPRLNVQVPYTAIPTAQSRPRIPGKSAVDSQRCFRSGLDILPDAPSRWHRTAHMATASAWNALCV